MKALKRLAIPLIALFLVLAWILYYHNEFVRSKMMPQWGWVQSAVGFFGQKVPAEAAADEDPDNTKNEIPVHVAQIQTATLHKYIDGFGNVTPRPSRQGQMAGSASIASPVAGIVSKIVCQIGQHVRTGDLLIQLDERQARAAEDQAQAGVKQAQASLAALRATPRPEQLQIAEEAVKKAQGAADVAQKNYDRQKQLAAQQDTSTKNLEQAAQDLSSAQADLSTAQKQLTLLKNSPTPEELAQEQAKVAQAEAALAAARAQRQIMAIAAPIDATVAALSVNPGESVDMTRTLVQLIAMDRLMVDVDLPADELPATAEGLPAEILPTSRNASSEGGALTVGKVTVVSPQVDPKNGSVMAGIDLPAATSLRPGQAVKVRIIAQEHKDCLAVPREAVVADENGDSVIAVVEGEQATHKTVKTGLEENGLIEIIADGLKEGMTVVTAGAFGLPQASHVKVVR